MKERQVSAYQKKLLDPRWQRKRLEIFQRDEWACRQCGATKQTLHVHHRYYEQNLEPWEYGEEALVTLCEACHEDETKKKTLLGSSTSPDTLVLQTVAFCPRLGRNQSTGFTVTLVMLLMRTAGNYDASDPTNVRAHAQFRLQDLACFTGQSLETIKNQITTMVERGYMLVDWESGIEEWHRYIVNISAIARDGWRMRIEDRRNGDTAFQD